ncbi:pyridoxal phosphate-dependent aminotransferase [Nonomuraea sp. CA-143628]|uniref:pyridoxal phosphate-dependent aminotransferase n=1 Tax=Nonomuraea sp. CA-143628 TaxID=3239997 RepID=UPI003D8DECC8
MKLTWNSSRRTHALSSRRRSPAPPIIPDTIAPNLALDQEITARLAAGEPVVHLGLGEARLPVHPLLLDRLAATTAANSYGPVAGDQALLQAAAGYFARRRMPTEPEQIVAGPGSKPLLFALLSALPGDVVLPRPCWLSYVPQALFAGRRVIRVPVPDGYGGVPDPDAFTGALREARRAGLDPRTVILTTPDNPTGALAPPELVRRVCELAASERVAVISDEIYRDTVHNPGTPYASPAEFLPARTIVTTGLSKSLALGGWRIGIARLPRNAWGRALRCKVLAIASEVWSALAGPMQAVAAGALDEPPEIVEHLRASAHLHGAVARAVHTAFTKAGAVCPEPRGGFYVYPDFEPARPVLAARGLTTSAGLQSYLLDQRGVAVLGGHHFGDDPGRLRFRAATSQLYGRDADEQWAALRDQDPVRLPHIAARLRTIAEAVETLTSCPLAGPSPWPR